MYVNTGNKNIKRVISLVLAVIIAFSACVCASAEAPNISTNIPIVVISGDANPIYDSEGNMTFSTKGIKELAARFPQEGESYTDALKRVVLGASIKLIKGYITGNFNDYYQLMYDSIDPIFRASRLDNNGENCNNSSLRQNFIDSVEYAKHTNLYPYTTFSYRFWYDWRLDPVATADDLNDYIKGVKQATGYDKVGVICRCLGANVFLAYVASTVWTIYAVSALTALL